MLYSIVCEDTNDSLDTRLATRPEHLQRLTELQNQGRLILAGPHPAVDNVDPGTAGFTGSLIVAEFNSLEDAKHWADTDPYKIAGVYQHVTVKPFKQVFPQ
ncbi:MAG TPA: YciI family protein [Crenotrichaceae bacterium]|nr:YciI family protein [Crenotrichaceae bacterium]